MRATQEGSPATSATSAHSPGRRHSSGNRVMGIMRRLGAGGVGGLVETLSQHLSLYPNHRPCQEARRGLRSAGRKPPALPFSVAAPTVFRTDFHFLSGAPLVAVTF